MATDQTAQKHAANSIPAYDGWLGAFHRTYQSELEAIVRGLPLREVRRGLDLACGDGFYTRRLLEQLGDEALLTACDLNRAYLGRARKEVANAKARAGAAFVAAGFDQLPFSSGSLDFVWCAQSLFSLPDPNLALQEIARTLKRGGRVAVLENDSLHQVVLPWPASLELAIRAAELEAHRAESTHADKFYIGRRLPEALAQTGFVSESVTTHAFDRASPLDADQRVLLQGYLDDTAKRAGPHLSAVHRDELHRLIDPGSPEHLLARPNLSFTWLSALALGRKATNS
jgi:ubiquinone/menaquinone biosynthesis C-methylase UbiE